MQIPSHMEVPQQVEGGWILLRKLVLLQHLAVLKTIYEDDIDFTNWEFHLNQNERIRIEIKTTLHQPCFQSTTGSNWPPMQVQLRDDQINPTCLKRGQTGRIPDRSNCLIFVFILVWKLQS